MSDNSTTRMIALYAEESEAPLFLTGFFRTPPENIHDTEKVEVDVMRDDEDIAVVIDDVSVGPRANEATLHTNKAFTPPVYDEKGAITAYDMIKRQPGANPFDNPDMGANAMQQAFRVFRRLERKIRRSVELQASQVLQTGTLTLTDQLGNVKFDLDFSPKATHFPTSGAVWALDGTTGDPLVDLEDLATIIRRDGKRPPNKLIFGQTAYQAFLANPEVKDRLDNRRIEHLSAAPETRGEGATFQGRVWIGHYLFEMWMYDGFFRTLGANTFTPYVGDQNVIMMADTGRLDLTFGSIPMIVQPEQRALPFLPPRITGEGFTFTTNAWVTDDGKSLFVSAGTRPLTIPTAIDTFGTIDTQAA